MTRKPNPALLDQPRFPLTGEPQLEELSRSSLEEILGQLPAGILVVAPSGKVLSCNRAAREILRRPVEPGEDIWHVPPGWILHLDGRPYAAEELPLARVLRTGEAITGEELRIRRGDGTSAVLSVNAVPVRDARGELVAAAVAFFDLTLHKETEDTLGHTQARLQRLIDTVDGIVWKVDVATFRFTFVSEQAVRLLGYRVDEWYQPGFWEGILHPDDRAWASDFCRVKTERMEPHDFEYRARDGRLVWLHDIVSVISEGGAPDGPVRNHGRRHRPQGGRGRSGAAARQRARGPRDGGGGAAALRVSRASRPHAGGIARLRRDADQHRRPRAPLFRRLVPVLAARPGRGDSNDRGDRGSLPGRARPPAGAAPDRPRIVRRLRHGLAHGNASTRSGRHRGAAPQARPCGARDRP